MFQISEAVVAALRRSGPVVALESTLVAHGLPWPQNLETARAMEEAVRGEGAEPASIAVLDGLIRVGLDDRGLETLARRPEGFQKAGVRDLPSLMASRQNAATTVASTIFLARHAGIEVMATGGIGGVHRDVLETGDISQDLLELARTPVAVVCSGFKSILDLPRTMEALETLGVPVVGFRTDRLPAFYSRDSGIGLERRVETPAEAAAVHRASRRLGLPSGLLVANPIPVESALSFDEVERMIERAMVEARRAGIAGKAVTPFLLERLHQFSGGRTLRANQALAIDNARVAAGIAVAVSRSGGR